MNDEIRVAVERLFSACLELTAAGKYHAFCRFEAQVGWVEIEAFPACTDYTGDHSKHRIINSRIAVAGWGVETAEDIARALSDLNCTTERLYGLTLQEAA
ncbi:hypothetical protein MT1_3765 [Pseudomonas sp. MT-1]|uniref:hypothetical protein n=1 Tax=Stutzerimonas stutzeri TaxID=316 RepID=UPI0005361E2C|nr:hypothetical protein [Stutzerimonas stutzeri]MCQ4282589.1 hypothetical protein [Stutzerimonas stutzeri]BAP80940.1 hypothetical protein MT1_3765 [Pseudomonas sp. MT-1]